MALYKPCAVSWRALLPLADPKYPIVRLRSARLDTGRSVGDWSDVSIRKHSIHVGMEAVADF